MEFSNLDHGCCLHNVIFYITTRVWVNILRSMLPQHWIRGIDCSYGVPSMNIYWWKANGEAMLRSQKLRTENRPTTLKQRRNRYKSI